MPSSVFVYGTLMSPIVWTRVTGHSACKRAPAYVTGYQRRPVKDAHYPALIRTMDEKDRVDGVLVALPAKGEQELLALMDRYETEMYQRHMVAVHTVSPAESRLPSALLQELSDHRSNEAGDDGLVPAYLYTWALDSALLQPVRDWDYEHFVLEDMPKFYAEMEEQGD